MSPRIVSAFVMVCVPGRIVVFVALKQFSERIEFPKDDRMAGFDRGLGRDFIRQSSVLTRVAGVVERLRIGARHDSAVDTCWRSRP